MTKQEFIDKHIKIVMAKTADAIRYELEQIPFTIKFTEKVIKNSTFALINK